MVFRMWVYLQQILRWKCKIILSSWFNAMRLSAIPPTFLQKKSPAPNKSRRLLVLLNQAFSMTTLITAKE
jgi:hypothetical protein